MDSSEAMVRSIAQSMRAERIMVTEDQVREAGINGGYLKCERHISGNVMICIFCNKSPSNLTPWCPDNPGKGCTYGLDHEYPCQTCGALLCKFHLPGDENRPKPIQVKKVDKQVCIKCSVHAKNPMSTTNGCSHEYPV